MRLDAIAAQPFDGATDHLAAELRWLDGRLRRFIAARRAAGRHNDDPARGLYVREEDVLAGLADPAPGNSLPDSARAIIDARAARSASPLTAMAARAGLDAIDWQILVMVAAPALDARFRAAYALAQNDSTRRWPCADLLLDLIAPPCRLTALGRFADDAPLRRAGLIRAAATTEETPFADRPLALDDRVLAALLGNMRADERLRDCIVPPPCLANWTPQLPPVPADAALILIECAGDPGARQMAARHAAARGQTLLVIDAAAALESPMPAAEIGRLIGREALLGAIMPFIDALGMGGPDARLEALLAAACGTGAAIMAAVRPQAVNRARLASQGVSIAGLALPAPTPAVRLGWWQQVTGDGALARRLAWSTSLGGDAIAALAGVPPDALEQAAAAHGARRLPALMQPLPHRWSRSELVLAQTTLRQLDDLTAFVTHWPRVLGDWGFAAAYPQARACLALFAGPSGTGKTMAAGIVAAAAGMPLYRVNLAAIFDKYVGETEKQLDRLFDAAADAGIALLFDEADVLFGARTQMNSAHDRYANLSVGYLLQRLESHDGLTILATNLPQNMDEAFARRLSHVVHFHAPDAGQRRELWRRALPADAAVSDTIDLDDIAATFDLSGGNIRNAMLAAAYLAAAEGTVIGTSHLVRAIGRELEKIGRAPIAADFGRLAGHGSA
jgi:hypothetical protein